MSSNSFNFITREKFDELMTNYLSERQHTKSLISRETANKLLNYFTKRENEQVDRTFRCWARSRFNTITIGDVVKVIDKKTGKPICVQDQLYDKIGNSHLELQHAGYKKTYAAVNYYNRFLKKKKPLK